ncbi:MAG TPA: MOSC domain-containing protein [Bauldia sp.]|nr:MOSC domain-containing protein [Bauldia sp.]
MLGSPAGMPHVAAIYRYPVKGLSPEPLETAFLSAGETIPYDRAFAIENGPSPFDPAEPRTLPKIMFLMLMRNESLAALQTHFDDATSTLTIRQNGAVVAEGNLATPEGRRAIETFFDAYSAKDLRGPAKVLPAPPGFSFSDVAKKVVSLINLETVRAVGREIGADVHPLRFRGNLHVEGMAAWDEFALVGRTVTIGGVTFEGVKRIERCAATNVDPLSARRDLTIPVSLMRAYGHADCGVYLRVVSGGPIAIGDQLAG